MFPLLNSLSVLEISLRVFCSSSIEFQEKHSSPIFFGLLANRKLEYITLVPEIIISILLKEKLPVLQCD